MNSDAHEELADYLRRHFEDLELRLTPAERDIEERGLRGDPTLWDAIWAVQEEWERRQERGESGEEWWDADEPKDVE